jgi:hypothetical protein
MELDEGRVSGICGYQCRRIDFSYNTVSITVAAEFVRLEIRRKDNYVNVHRKHWLRIGSGLFQATQLVT